ncbi:MAG TPA: response regulator [Bacteroidales bacterium]|nr:response regulator [Bacteroidales bacterium]
MAKEKLIFVVDDDPFINKLVTKRFESDSFRLESFESGEECLDAINRNPDLIILDYLFTDPENHKALNGMEVFDRIKKIRPALPVIMLSGQEDGEVVLELARKGIDDYVIKDNNLIDNLSIAINELLPSR